MEKRCSWCNPNDDGMYSAACFDGKIDEENARIRIFVYGGQMNIEIDKPVDKALCRVSLPINFCPICGNRLRNELATL